MWIPAMEFHLGHSSSHDYIRTFFSEYLFLFPKKLCKWFLTPLGFKSAGCWMPWFLLSVLCSSEQATIEQHRNSGSTSSVSICATLQMRYSSMFALWGGARFFFNCLALCRLWACPRIDHRNLYNSVLTKA